MKRQYPALSPEAPTTKASPASLAETQISHADSPPSLRSFIERLNAWPAGQRVLSTCLRQLHRPFENTKIELLEVLYRSYAAHLLQHFQLQRSPGEAHWEWSSLYTLAARIHPNYYSAEQVSEALGTLPPSARPFHQALLEALLKFFDLRRRKFPLDWPSRRIRETESAQWLALFPQAEAWSAIRILQQCGLHCGANEEASRAYMRFAYGQFHATRSPEALRDWQAQLAALDPPGAADRSDTLAALFGGAFSAWDAEGPCGDTPNCAACLLQADCRWPRGEASEMAADAVSARIRLGQAEHLDDLQLLHSALGLPDEDAPALREALKRTPWRDLADCAFVEVQRWGKELGLEGSRILALLELCRRYPQQRLRPGMEIRSAWDVFRHFGARMREMKQECLWVLMLDGKRRFMGSREVSLGGLDSSPSHPREVFRPAIRESAYAIILVHNHPSGDPSPSQADILLTQQLVEAGHRIGVPVLDHVIVGDGAYASLMEMGYLGKEK